MTRVEKGRPRFEKHEDFGDFFLAQNKERNAVKNSFSDAKSSKIATQREYLKCFQLINISWKGGDEIVVKI